VELTQLLIEQAPTCHAHCVSPYVVEQSRFDTALSSTEAESVVRLRKEQGSVRSSSAVFYCAARMMDVLWDGFASGRQKVKHPRVLFADVLINHPNKCQHLETDADPRFWACGSYIVYSQLGKDAASILLHFRATRPCFPTGAIIYFSGSLHFFGWFPEDFTFQSNLARQVIQRSKYPEYM
jgi:hypothetical protein